MSNYRLRRLQQQKDFLRLKEVEGKEKLEMERRLMQERMAYEETKDKLDGLRKKIKKLRRSNKRAALTEKKIDFLINNDF